MLHAYVRVAHQNHQWTTSNTECLDQELWQASYPDGANLHGKQSWYTDLERAPRRLLLQKTPHYGKFSLQKFNPKIFEQAL